MNNNIEIYTKNICGYCDRAKNIFKSKNLSYKEYNINKNPEYIDVMIKRTKGMRLMPQIFINNFHVGGFDKLKELIDNGKFDSLLLD